MASAPSKTLTQEWSPEVAALAIEFGLEEVLPLVLDITRRVFPSARNIEVVFDEDPEIANDRHILFDVEVDLSVAANLEARKQWWHEVRALCATADHTVFRLGIR